MNTILRATTILFTASLLAGCAAHRTPDEMKTVLAGQSVDVQIPPNAPGIPFGAGSPDASGSGTAGAMAASNGLKYGHAAQLDKLAEKQISGVNMSTGPAYTIASDLKNKFGSSKSIKEPPYKIQFEEGKFLIPSGGHSYWVNYVLTMYVLDAQGKRVSSEMCWSSERDMQINYEIHSIDEWRTNHSLVENMREKIVSTCLQKFSKALGG